MTSLLIQGGRVIDPASGFDQTADVLIIDGIVREISEGPIKGRGGRLKASDSQERTIDAEGCIVWSDPGMAPMVVGLRLASHDMSAPASARASLALALRYRQPVRALVMQLNGAPAIAGRWQIDAAPTFDPGTGAYRGHAGRMRREVALNAAPKDNEVDSQADLIARENRP